MWFISIAVILFSHFGSAEPKATDPAPQAPPAKSVPAVLLKLADTYFSPFAIVVDKSTRTLSVWKQEGQQLSLVTYFPSDMGRTEGNKKSPGDHKTPEGVYFPQQMLEGPGLNFDEYGVRAFTLDYPNYFDRLENKGGSGIWLHAIPETKTLSRGSRGCVVVRNEAIKALSPYITLGKTPVIVLNKVEYVSVEQKRSREQQFLTWLETWRQTWTNKDVGGYMKFYADDFRALGMNKRKWQEFKGNLAQKYQFIKVDLSHPMVVNHGPYFVVRFLQDYQSDLNTDFGEKILYVRQKADGQYEIMNEEWSALEKSQVIQVSNPNNSKANSN